MNRKLVAVSLAALLPLVACGGGSGNGATGDDTYELKLANVTTAETPEGQTLLDFKKAVEEQSDGRISVQLHQGGQLGGELETLDQLRAGGVSAVLLHGISLLQDQDPSLAVEELPFLFPSQEVAHEAVDGEFGDLAADRIDALGFKVLAYWENGFRHFTNNVRPIESPDDMKGLKFRSAESNIRLDMFDRLGATGVPMAFTELYTALQQETVDGQENPLSIIHSSGFAKVQEYLSVSGHIWNSAPFLVSPEWWDQLPPDLQDIVQEQAMDLRLKQRERMQQQDDVLLEQLEKDGMKINEIDRAAFVEATQPTWDAHAEQIGPEFMELAQQIRDSES